MHLLITVLIIVFGLYFTFQKPSNRINNVYIIICGLLLIVQAGFREIDLVHMKNSNDTIRYYYMFQDMKNISFGTLLSKFSLVAKDYYSRDMGYSVLVKLFQLFSTDFRTFLVLIAFIITTPLCFIIRIFTPPIYGLLCWRFLCTKHCLRDSSRLEFGKRLPWDSCLVV